MYKKSITELPQADPLSGDEYIAIVQDGRTKKVALADSISAIGQVYSSDTPPDNPFEGQLWLNTAKSRLYLWKIGNLSSQWVQV